MQNTLLDCMKKIIEYVGGTKGDMVCRFLNNIKPSLNHTGKTYPISLCLKLINPFDYTLDHFEEVLSKNTYEYIPSHPLWITYDQKYVDLLKKYDYEILSIKFEPKHYITIQIESMIKNQLTGLLEKLDTAPDLAYKMRARTHKLFNEMTEHRTLLFYEELFCSDLAYPLHPHRKEEWLSLVENSWCDYNKHGYREFNLPESFEEGINPYVINVEKYLKGMKVILKESAKTRDEFGEFGLVFAYIQKDGEIRRIQKSFLEDFQKLGYKVVSEEIELTGEI